MLPDFDNLQKQHNGGMTFKNGKMKIMLHNLRFERSCCTQDQPNVTVLGREKIAVWTKVDMSLNVNICATKTRSKHESHMTQKTSKLNKKDKKVGLGDIGVPWLKN